MLTHIIILLDDTSASFCHYDNSQATKRLISIETLKAGITWAMKENLNIQFVFPDDVLPDEYAEAIESVDHVKIKPDISAHDADVVVLTDWKKQIHPTAENSTCILKAKRAELAGEIGKISEILHKVFRLNIVLTDVEGFTDEEIKSYQELLLQMVEQVYDTYKKGKAVQVNLLTDHPILAEMNNCNAGVNNVTLAPNGKFYLCPAFYYEDEKHSVGSLETGLEILNQQLLQLDHSPICRRCDAWHCRRCIWLNRKLTGEQNTPSHQQCVVSHLERNVSRELQIRLGENGIRLSNSHPIKEIDYLDPFNLINRWK